MQESKNNRLSKENENLASREYKFLYNIIKSANEATDIEQLLKIILDAIIKFMNFDGGGIYLVNEKKRIAEVICNVDLPEDFINMAVQINIDDPPYEQVFNRGIPIFSENYPEMDPKFFIQGGFQSLASIPLITKQKIIGTLNIASKQRYEFSIDEKELLEIIAREIGTVIVKMNIEQELKENNQKVKVLFETLQEFLFIINSEGNIIHTNPIAISRLNYSKEELIGMNMIKLYPVEFQEKAKESIADIINNQEGICEFPFITKNGELIYVETSISMGKWGNENVLIGISHDISKRKKIEEILKKKEKKITDLKILESELRYGLILETSNEGYYEVDLDGKFKFLNRTFCEMFECSMEEIIDQNFIQFLGLTEEIENLSNAFKDVFNTGQPKNDIQIEIALKNDITKIIETSIHLNNNSEGHIVGYCGIVRDITNRKIAEEKLKESEKIFRNIIENTRDAIIIVGFDGRFKYISPQLGTILKRNDIHEGDLFSKYIYKDDLEYLLQAFKNATIKGKTFIDKEVEFRTIDGNGKIIWLTSITKNYHDDSGNIIGFIVLLTDITEDKEGQQKLKESEVILRKKYKELNCLYGISKLLENKEATLEDIISGTLYIIPLAWELSNEIYIRIIVSTKFFDP